MAESKGKKKCFVIGPIGKDGSETRNNADWLLEGIIRPVLENDPFDYAVQRADHVAEPGLITDQVITAVTNAGSADGYGDRLHPLSRHSKPLCALSA